MKKLLLLSALFIFACSYGQNYDDLKKITSLETFKRLVIEKGYEKIPDYDYPQVLLYAKPAPLNIDNEVNYISIAYYYQTEEESGSWRFILTDNFMYRDYDKLFTYVKKNCEFSEIIDRKGLDDPTQSIEFAVYNCEGIGKLGFAKKDGAGFVHYFSKK